MTVENAYRSLPSVDRLLADDRVRTAGDGAAPEVLTGLVRETLESVRSAIARGEPAPTYDQIVEAVLHHTRAVLRPSLWPVINATGVIIHTNLGRAPLSREAIAAMEAVSHGYSNLEFDLDEGERGSRHVHLESLLRQITGAEAAIAVNNNASAVLLALSALAGEREVIVSRGQAVEIGGGFRIPDVMRQSGTRLVEVGTTNRTYLRDYEQAITEETAAILRVHASNFRIIGFTESVPPADLARLAHERGRLMLDDLGSGCLLDTTRFGLAPEPTVQDSLAAGTDLAFFSGDKLLGGPQAGIVAGRRELVDRLKRHPLARAVRMDKASIAGLTATLAHYLKGEALEKVPVWRMIAMPLKEVERRARRWARAIGPRARVVDGRSMVGGGSLPEESLPTKLIAIDGESGWVTQLARRLRTGDPPVVGRIEKDALLLDPRTLGREEGPALVAAVKAALD
ncbi:MAG: L-seryl-tRNA(Sec) selenium transferase [Chloroflexi bacterium]|nr:L-seryl-tRNA(Sec) selenium transferase [Chloroflexota bacterium]